MSGMGVKHTQASLADCLRPFPWNSHRILELSSQSVGGLKSQSLLTSTLGTAAATHHLIRIKCFTTESQ